MIKIPAKHSNFGILWLILSLFSQVCQAQERSGNREFFSKEFNWRIKIPEGFDTVSAAEWMQLQDKGSDAIEKTYDAKVDNRAKTIFVFKSDQFNYFEANYQPFDTLKDGSYIESCKNVLNIIYGTFEDQMPGAELDSITYEQLIDGKLFQAFKVTVTIPGKIVLEVLSFSHLFGYKDFTINIMTIDKQKQKLMLDAWMNSKF